MEFQLNDLIGGTTTLLAVPLTWWLTTATTARAEAKAERTQLRMQADAMITAVTEVQSVTVRNAVTTENLRQRLITVGLSQAAFWSGMGRAEGSGWRRVGAGTSELVRWLTQDRYEARRNLAVLPSLTARVVAASGPLLRHSDPGVVFSTERLTEAANRPQDRDRLSSVLEEFGRTVRLAVTPPPSRWRRVLRRIRRALALGH